MVLIAGLVVGLVGIGTAIWWYRTRAMGAHRDVAVMSFLTEPGKHTDWMIRAGEQCGNAPFEMPTDGFIGYLWNDSFRPGHHHAGIDIFGGTDVGVTPIYAAYPGYLTRLVDWKSSLIIRHPDDPLQPGRQIWTYYTHMAGPMGDSYIVEAFPPGASEVFVEAGTLLGYQGNFSGTPGSPVGVHLHFSVVKDDGAGGYLNELDIANTYDPSPYLGLKLNADENLDEIPVCR